MPRQRRPTSPLRTRSQQPSRQTRSQACLCMLPAVMHCTRPQQCSWPAEKQTPADKGKGRSPDMPPQGDDAPSQSGDDDEDDACGFCRYMKGGGCKKEFKVRAWQALPCMRNSYNAQTALHVALSMHRCDCLCMNSCSACVPAQCNGEPLTQSRALCGADSLHAPGLEHLCGRRAQQGQRLH